MGPDICECTDSQWTGTDCSQGRMWWLVIHYIDYRVVTFIANCNPRCENGGRYVEPNICVCSEGWNGTTCSECKFTAVVW